MITLTHVQEAEEEKQNQTLKCQVALSFASEDRARADEVARALTERKRTIWLDDFESLSVQGRLLYEHLSQLCRSRAGVCVIFSSQAYARQRWADETGRAALARTLKENAPRLVLVRLDDTEIPGSGVGERQVSWTRDGLVAIVRAIEQALEPGPANLSAIRDFMRRDKMSGRESVRFMSPGGARIMVRRRFPSPLEVEIDGVVVGHVDPDGVFHPSPSGHPATPPVTAALREVNEDPWTALTRFGLGTGTCGVCGRQLTDPRSIERGIGPVCAGLRS